jgi:hypothetical protein
MRPQIQRLSVWAGPLMVVIWGAGFLLAGFLPLPRPGASASEVAAMYEGHRTEIRIGLALTIACSGLLAPYIGVISAQMRRIEGPNSPLAFAQAALGALLIIEFVYPMMILQVAAFRPDRPDASVQVIHDLGWMLFVGVICTAVMQLIVIGIVILQDDRPDPVFPRWAGYLNFWVALLITGPTLIPFFKDGPFAWDGLLAWWVGASAFCLWLFIMTPLLLRAIAHEEAEADRDRPVVRGDIDRLTAEVSALRDRLLELTGAQRNEVIDGTLAAGTGGGAVTQTVARGQGGPG